MTTPTEEATEGAGGGGGGGGAPEPEPAVVRGFFESPAPGAVVSGIDIIRGWGFADTRGVDIEQVELYLDRQRTAVIPCCSARPDVAGNFPTAPAANAGQSGWGITTNWGNLTPGPHTLQVVVTSTDGGRWVSDLHPITVLKPGDIAFADRFSLAEAEARLEGNTLVLDGVVIGTATTEQEMVARYGWQTGAQGVRLLASRPLQTARTQPGGMKRLLAGLWAWGRAWLRPGSVSADPGLARFYEAPANRAQVAGIGLIRGWAFPRDDTDAIATVTVDIDGGGPARECPVLFHPPGHRRGVSRPSECAPEWLGSRHELRQPGGGGTYAGGPHYDHGRPGSHGDPHRHGSAAGRLCVCQPL